MSIAGLASRRGGVLSTAAVLVLGLVFLVLATQAQGEVVRKADLFDGGVWVTNAEQARFGRLNKPAGQLDAGVAAPVTGNAGLDVLQDGQVVLGLSASTNQLLPLNATMATLTESGVVALPASGRVTGREVVPQVVDVRGGSVAVVDPAKGSLRAQRVDPRAAVATLDRLQPQAKALATVGAAAVVAVGTDGTVYAASGATGDLVTLRPDAVGGFTAPVTTRLGFTSASLQLTAVGSHWVVLDARTGQVRSDALTAPVQAVSPGPGGSAAPAPSGNVSPASSGSAARAAGEASPAALQQPGPDADSVLVQTTAGLTQVAFGSGTVSTPISLPAPSAASTLLVSRPVRLADCVHAAWAGPDAAWYGRSCGGAERQPAVQVGTLGRGVRTDGVKLRVNRGLIVLNDLDSGNLWDLDNKPVKVDNWDSVIPPPQEEDKNLKKDPTTIDDQVASTPPLAEPDELSVRPGRTSTLHVLDNDSDSQGSILGIAPRDVTQPDAADVAAAVSVDGQSVQVTVPDEPSATTFRFTYTVNNGSPGRTGSSSALVTVHIVDDSVNTAPVVRGGQARMAAGKYPVVRGGHVTVGVVGDWRDGESDPLSVEAPDAGVGVDPSGALDVAAADRPGPMAVAYVVADGHGGSAPGRATVSVLADDARPEAPQTQPDVLRAVVGKPVQLRPLGNDIPGADPSDPGARMRLAAAVRGPGALTVDSNVDTGVLTITGQTPGTHVLTYAAQVGSAIASGRVRVDILPDPSDDQPPVAAPDSATLRDQAPVVTDVLSNDASPRSDVLVVQKAVADAGWLQPSVVQGRWLRLQATSPLTGAEPRSASVAYTVTDGTKTAIGRVSVVQKPPPASLPVPHVEDDASVVRLGDVVTVPVLDNDTMSGGVPLRLDPKAVAVVSGKGQVFVSGSVLRFVPDAAPLTADEVVTLEYAAYPEGSPDRAVTGRVTVTVKPLPTPTTPNQPPTARSFSASVTAGDATTITVPTSGIDPDGDLTYVAGIVGQDGNAVSLALGRVTSFGAAALRYEAYPTSSGTEVIRYVVRDRFGATSEAFIRVGVVQPGDPQPPVAVADDVVAAPGRTVSADVLGNDLVGAGDEVTFEDLAKTNDAEGLTQFARQADNTFRTRVPEEGPAKVLTYGITDGLFEASRATLTVRGQKGFDNPPTAVDDTAKPVPGQTTTLVDVLANDRDVDGDPASLSVSSAVGEGVAVEGRQVRVTLLDHPRVVSYVVADADGATAMALVFVPTADNGAPFVTPGRSVQMDPDSTLKVNLADYVSDPRGRRVTVTSPDTVSASPHDDLAATASGDAEITLTSSRGYAGPAALMLQVTDAKGPDDATGLTAYVSIPVQVGPKVPVLRCPDYLVTLVGGGAPRTVDIPRLCHAWLPDGLDPASVEYTAAWSRTVPDVELSQSGPGRRKVVLTAAPAASGDGAMTVGAKGARDTFTIRVHATPTKGTQAAKVTAQVPPPVLRPITVDGLVAGTSRTVAVAPFLQSPLTNPQCVVGKAFVRSGAGVSATTSGCSVTVAAARGARGSAVVIIEASDGPGRLATGQVTVTVRGAPDPPTRVGALADRVKGGTARVGWSPPANDGGLPVLQYEVLASSGKRLVCAASPCTVTGLSNGTPVSFTVRARNAVDWSPPSAASPQVTPDTTPRAVTVGAVTPGDRSLRVGWAAPANEGSPVDLYQVQWVNVNGGAGGGLRSLPAGPTGTTLTGLVNDDAYSVRVQAHNGAGWGPYGPAVLKQSVGTPPAVAAPRLTPRSPTPSSATAQVTIAWSATDPNGPALTTYTVYRDGAAISTVSASGQRTASDTVPYDGRTHAYAVTATNGGGRQSARANSTTYRATGVPESPTAVRVSTPRPDFKGSATWTLRSSRSSAYSQVQWQTSAGASGIVACAPTCSGATLPGLGTTSQTLSVRALNDAGTWSPWSASSAAYRPFGPTNKVTGLTQTHTNTSITFTWAATPENGRPITGYKITGARITTVAPGARSVTFTGLGFSTTRAITVQAVATTSGAGPGASASGTTNARPTPTMKVTAGPSCSGRTCDPAIPSNCKTTCFFVVITTTNFQSSSATCVISGQTGGAFSTKTVATNRAVRTTAFYGYLDTVTVTCRGVQVTESATDRQPNWGG